MLEGSEGRCGCELARTDSLAESFLPNRHQLLLDPDWQPTAPTNAANVTAQPALMHRIARAPYCKVGKRAIVRAPVHAPLKFSSLRTEVSDRPGPRRNRRKSM
jgi:hypothetical protein